MAHANVETTLPRSPEEVFDLVADIRNESRWHPDYRGATKVTDGPVGKGTAFDARYRGFGRMRVEITEYERPSKLRFDAVGRPLAMDALFRFEPAGGGTQMTMDVDATLRGPMRVARPVFGRILQRETAKRPSQLLGAFETIPPR